MVVLVALALIVLAWPQGDDGGEGEGGPLNAIAAAAERTQEEPGGRAVMHSIVTPAEGPSFTITGQMVFDDAGRTAMDMTVPNPQGGDSMELQVVGEGTAMYIKSEMFDSLPGDAEWIGLDFEFGKELDSPVPADVDARGELALLEEATGDVQKLGKEEVRGVPTTRYRGTVGVSENAERWRDEGEDEIASLVEENGSPVQIEAWIDADGLVRRMRIVQSQPGEGEGPTKLDMTMDLFDFGSTHEIDVPDSSEVLDMTAVAEEGVGLD